MADYSELVTTPNGGTVPDNKIDDKAYTAELLDQNLNFGVPSSPVGERPTAEISQSELQALSATWNDGPIEPQSPLTRPTLSQQSIHDPMMRQAYAYGKPAAGLPARQNHDQYYSPQSAQYKMASDIFGTGMDRSWSPASPNGRILQQGPHRTEPTSFKITEPGRSSLPSTPQMEPEHSSSLNLGTKKTRESAGNPLTGQGYDNASTKTAKRYFEGSNANQKLW